MAEEMAASGRRRRGDGAIVLAMAVVAAMEAAAMGR